MVFLSVPLPCLRVVALISVILVISPLLDVVTEAVAFAIGVPFLPIKMGLSIP